MDQQAAHAARGRSPSAGHHQQPHIRNGHSPSPHPFPSSPEPNIGLGLGLESPPANVSVPQYNAPAGYTNFANAAPGTSHFLSPNQALPDASAYDPAYGATSQPPGFSQNLLAAEFNGSGDFSLFSSSQGDQFNNGPLFGDNPAIGTPDLGSMASPQSHHSPTPPHMLKPEPHHPGSAHQSPAFNQHQFVSPPPGQHSRHASLGPEAALLGGQVDWSQAQFQGHRRSPSEYSDISSAQHSPNLIAQDSFDGAHSDHGHSPMQRPLDGFYDGVSAGLGSFSISDSHMNHAGRSPSHSPAMSPRIMPQPQMGDMGHPSPGFVLGGTTQGYNATPSISYSEAFPTLPAENAMTNQMAPPSINIDFAPNARLGGDMSKQPLDQTSLTPPERGRARARQRAVTDPYNNSGPGFVRPNNPNSLSPYMGTEAGTRSRSGSDTPRSISPALSSPGDRSGSASAASRRRQSMSAVPNNVIALRLADPEYQAAQDSGNTKRVQKHPATFQCTLCPKRFTRAYNLRSHLRTHTDERPFVCTVCGKAFARQHDRKRHEGLHSGEKKFVCKGDLKAGGQWGCGRRFARADALGRHFRSEAGRICIKPLLDEEFLERQRVWQQQRMQNMAQNMAVHQQAAVMDPNAFPPPPMDATGFALPASLLAQYPALAQLNWQAPEMSGNLEDDISGRSSFDASDYEGEDTGYVSGPGTGYGEGGMQQNFGEVGGYSSDFGGR